MYLIEKYQILKDINAKHLTSKLVFVRHSNKYINQPKRQYKLYKVFFNIKSII